MWGSLSVANSIYLFALWLSWRTVFITDTQMENRWETDGQMWWYQDKETLFPVLTLCDGNPRVTERFISRGTSDMELRCFLVVSLWLAVQQRVVFSLIWGAIVFDVTAMNSDIVTQISMTHGSAMTFFVSIKWLLLLSSIFWTTNQHMENYRCEKISTPIAKKSMDFGHLQHFYLMIMTWFAYVPRFFHC